MAIDAFRVILDQATRRAPEDDRVWLALANLAIRTGDFNSARRLLDDCLARRPEDPSVWQAALNWAMGTEDVDQVRRALGHLPADRFSAARIEALRAWLAATRGDAVVERKSLERLVQIEPGNSASWERLAVLAAEHGQGEDSGHFRNRKAAIDEARQRYKDLYNEDHFAQDATELARLAETLGRGFEAVGFLTWITRREPFNQDARAALVRLQGTQIASSSPGPGRNLAELLSADLAGKGIHRRHRLSPPTSLHYRSRTTPRPPTCRSSTRTENPESTSSPNSLAGESA